MIKKKCGGWDRNKNPCRNYGVNNTNFCIFHEHLIGYDDMMLKNQSLCSGCRKYVYNPLGGLCEECKAEKKIKREKNKIKAPKCKICTNKAQSNGYCGYHQKSFIKEQIEEQGYKMCPKCKNALPAEYEFVNCESCLKDERNKYIQRQYKINSLNNASLMPKIIVQSDIEVKKLIPKIMVQSDAKIKKLIPEIIVQSNTEIKKLMPEIIIQPNIEVKNINKNQTQEEKYAIPQQNTGKWCTRCAKYRNNDEFIGNRNQITKTCKSVCRAANKKADENRVGRIKDYSNKNQEKSEEIKKVELLYNSNIFSGQKQIIEPKQITNNCINQEKQSPNYIINKDKQKIITKIESKKNSNDLIDQEGQGIITQMEPQKMFYVLTDQEKQNEIMKINSQIPNNYVTYVKQKIPIKTKLQQNTNDSNNQEEQKISSQIQLQQLSNDIVKIESEHILNNFSNQENQKKIDARRKQADYLKQYRYQKGITKGNKKTAEQKRDEARLRKQKSRSEIKKRNVSNIS